MKNKLLICSMMFVCGLCLGVNAVFAAEAAESANLMQSVKKIETALAEAGICVGGGIAVEAGYEDYDVADPAETDSSTSDLRLATVELGIDVNIVKYVSGHILFLFEEDDTEPMDVDEAFICIDGEDRLPLYLSAGRQYLPFGAFNSHFISDPLTLELGETRESAVVGGFHNDFLEIAAGVFNGDVNKTGESDDHIDGFAAGAVATLPEAGGFCLQAGVSYIANIGESDGLEGEDGIDAAANTIDSYVPGFAAFISVAYAEKLFLEAEYLGATEAFKAGELAFDGGSAYQPQAFNLELAYNIIEDLQIGVRYGGSKDGGDFLPESQYGGVVSYNLFKNTTLALEYQYDEFENDDTRQTLTAQLAVEF